jgi:hypothetical protein
MEIQLLVGDKGYIDFKTPVRMSREQKEEFIKLLKSIFLPSVVEEQNTETFRPWRIGEKKSYPREWSAEEYEVLLSGETHEEIASKIGRSPMAVFIKDGEWRPRLIRWCEQRNKNLLTGNKLQIIKEFLKEKEELIKQRREEKKKQNKLLKIDKEIFELENEKRDLENLLSHGNPRVRDEVNKELMKIDAKLEKLTKLRKSYM